MTLSGIPGLQGDGKPWNKPKGRKAQINEFRTSHTTMRITKQTGYAIRILIECATAESDLLKVADISQRLDITKQNVFKVVNVMSHAGLVAPVRGPSGGVKLARQASEISIGEVVRLLELSTPESGADTSAASTPNAAAPLSGVIDDAFEAFIAVLDQHTLADFAKKKVELPMVGASTKSKRGGGGRSETKSAARRTSRRA